MSDSSLIVEVPNEARWPARSIDSFCSVISRGSAPVYVEQSDVLAIGQRCVAGTGFTPDFARPHSTRAMSNVLRAECGDVLLNSTGTGTIGRSVVFDAPGEFIVDGHVTVLRPRIEVADSTWLNSLLRSKWFQRHLERFCYAGSTNQLELSRTPLRTSCLPVPPLVEQQAIARLLDTLDTAIHETEALIAKLKAVKQGLLHDLLTRGIDANGELRPPQAQAPELYKQSELGWIPRGWDLSQVSAEFDVDAGITLGAHRVPRLRPRKYLRVANVHRGRLLLDEIAELEATDGEATARALKPGDLLIVEGHASTSEIGRCAMATEAVRGMLFQNHLFRLQAKRLSASFALHWLNGEYARSYWRCEAATSSGLNTINRSKLGRMLVAVPSLEEQELIVARESACAARLAAEGRYLESLQSQKQGLMDDLLTGRVRVSPLLAAAAGQRESGD